MAGAPPKDEGDGIRLDAYREPTRGYRWCQILPHSTHPRVFACGVLLLSATASGATVEGRATATVRASLMQASRDWPACPSRTAGVLCCVGATMPPRYSRY